MLRLIICVNFKIFYFQSYFYQLLSGIVFCYLYRILYRDLKLQNFFIDVYGFIKLVDFGFVRVFGVLVRFYIYEVVILWYRVFEIFLGCRYYFIFVDVWSIGCIFVEMVSIVVFFL